MNTAVRVLIIERKPPVESGFFFCLLERAFNTPCSHIVYLAHDIILVMQSNFNDYEDEPQFKTLGSDIDEAFLGSSEEDESEWEEEDE